MTEEANNTEAAPAVESTNEGATPTMGGPSITQAVTPAEGAEQQGIQQANVVEDPVEAGIPQPMKIEGRAQEKVEAEATPAPEAETSADNSSIGDAPPIRAESVEGEAEAEEDDSSKPSTESKEENQNDEENNEEGESEGNQPPEGSQPEQPESDEEGSDKSSSEGDTADGESEEESGEDEEQVDRFEDPFSNMMDRMRKPDQDPRSQGEEFLSGVPGKMRVY